MANTKCFLGLIVCLACTTPLSAQTSSLLLRDTNTRARDQARPPLRLDQSWTHIPREAPQLQRLKINSTVFVHVVEAANATSDGEVQRRKSALYDLLISDWVTLRGLALKPSPQNDGDPRIAGQLNQTFRAENEVETQESITLKIAARIADIRPNGNLVLEAHKRIRVNNEVWEISLSGICSADDLEPGRVVRSEKIVDLLLEKRERGHVRAATDRGWFVRLLDTFDPF